MRNATVATSALLVATFFTGCGKGAPEPSADNVNPPTVPAVAGGLGTLEFAESEPGRQDAEKLALLRQECNKIALTKLELIASPAISVVSTPTELDSRIALCILVQAFEQCAGEKATAPSSSHVLECSQSLSTTRSIFTEAKFDHDGVLSCAPRLYAIKEGKAVPTTAQQILASSWGTRQPKEK